MTVLTPDFGDDPPPHNCQDEAEEVAESPWPSGSFQVTVRCGVCRVTLSSYVDSVM